MGSNGRSSTAEEEEAVSSLATKLFIGAALPMVLKTVLELDLLELIQKSGLDASASELAAQLPTNNPDAANMIDRMLRFLSAQSILVCSVNMLPDGGVERRYSLGPVCKVLTKVEGEVSIAPLFLFSHEKVSMESWYHLKDAILEGGIPFDRAHGMNVFEYLATDPSYNKTFNKAMSAESLRIEKIVESYKGFEGLESLVDVGGGNGTILGMITSKYPSIKGFNFDLPHVIRDAPSYPGVKHVPGDMFLSLPNADAIFMKCICHNWSDAHCLKLLKNCYDALPSNGKVIIAEFVVPDEPDNGPEFTRVTKADVMMMAYTPGGKERTFKEFEALAQQAGFTKIQKVCQVFPLWIMELHK